MSEQPVPISNVPDDDAARYVVTRSLRMAGFGVVAAATGADALRLARARPDLVVLDVNLPDIGGFEVCRMLKADPATASIPVLHLSASFVRSDDKAQGLEGGADGYLTQPVESPELTATVKALLRMRKAEEAAQASVREWQATFDAIRDGVCLLDLEGRIRRCNAAMADLLQRPAREINHRLYSEVMAEAFRNRDVSWYVRVEETGRREIKEIHSGDRWLRVTTDPVRDERGAVTGAVHIVTDITQSKETAIRQRTFLREVLRSVTEGRLRLSDSREELPAPFAPVGESVPLLPQTLRALRHQAQEAAVRRNFPTSAGKIW